MNKTPPGIEVFQYNAFSDQPFAGNPAGVVLDAGGLADAAMQKIARQLNLAETAFLVRPTRDDADVRLRWFTPTCEVTLCGHATIASFTAAMERGIYDIRDAEVRELKVETLSGVLRIRLSRDSGVPRVAMQIPLPEFRPLQLDRDRFAALWKVDASELEGEWWVLQELNYWYLPVRDLTTLRRLKLDSESLAQIDDRAAFSFFTRETMDRDSHWHLRFFAPFHGVDEDVVTGSAQGPMGPLYLRLADDSTDGWRELKGEQGDSLGRPGRVQVRVLRERGEVKDLEIVGGAIAMLEGKLLL